MSWEGLDSRATIAQREDWLKSWGAKTEPGVLLATCDRVEWYPAGDTPDRETARHLFQVASGLESPLLGENQILGQVRDAYTQAAEKHHLDKHLHKLFQAALKTGKRVRSETGLSKGAVSHAQAAAVLVERESANRIQDLRIAVIGVNNLARGFLKFLASKGAPAFFLGNRTLDKARQVCDELGGEAFALERLPEILKRTDVLLSATSAPHLIVRSEHFSALDAGEGPRLLIDLAVPRDIDPELENRPGVKLFNIHDLEALMASQRDQRAQEATKARLIVDQEVEKFLENLKHS